MEGGPSPGGIESQGSRDCQLTFERYCSYITKNNELIPLCFMFLKGNLAVYINNQLQTTVGQKAMVELRSRVIGLKVRFTIIFSMGCKAAIFVNIATVLLLTGKCLYICTFY